MVLSFGIDTITMDKKENSHTIKVEEMDVEDNVDVNENRPSPTMRLTNFSIHEILKPEFGVKKSQPIDFTSAFSAFSPVRNHERFHEKIPQRCTPSASPPPSPSGSMDSQPSSPESCSSSSNASPGTESRASLWPAWVYCTRYSDRPSSGPRSRKLRKGKDKTPDEKRPRTAFTNEQLQRLKREFEECRYLTEQRRTDLAQELQLTEAQIKIWFQNKRAKIKKTTCSKNTLAINLMAQGLYNHATVTIKEEEEIKRLQEAQQST